MAIDTMVINIIYEMFQHLRIIGLIYNIPRVCLRSWHLMFMMNIVSYNVVQHKYYSYYYLGMYVFVYM